MKKLALIIIALWAITVMFVHTGRKIEQSNINIDQRWGITSKINP
jgi:hypothetical protein